MPPHPQQLGSPSLQRPPQEILARLNQPPISTSPVLSSPAVTQMQQQIPGPGQLIQQQQQNLQRERRIIWSGYLEWHEKQKGKEFIFNVLKLIN